MALQTKVPTYTRVRYFNGLFLYAPDFKAESDYHLATRRHLNYLLFRPGVLSLGDSEQLTVSDLRPPEAPPTTVTVATGSAIVPDAAGRRQLHEVHLEDTDPRTLDLSSADVWTGVEGSPEGRTVYVTLAFDEGDAYSTPSGDRSPPTEEDRRREQAVLGASATEPAADEAIVLATVTYRAAGITDLDIENRRSEGGLRSGILSQELIEDLRAVLAASLVSIEIAPAGATREVGATWVYQATGIFDDGSLRRLGAAAGLVWSSSDPSIVSIDASTGAATAESPGGPVTITAQAQDVTGTTEASVAAILVDIDVSPAAVTLELGASRTFTASGTYSDGSSRPLTAADGLTWTSAEPSIVRIDAATGEATAESPGGPVAIAAAAAGVTGQAAVTVADPTLLSITVVPATVELEIGETVQLDATGTFSDDSSRQLTAADGLTWTSADPSIVSIDASTGEATAQSSNGPVTITATAGGVTGSARAWVAPPDLLSIVVTPKAFTLAVGGSHTFTATGSYSDGTSRVLSAADGLVWTSAQPEIVSIGEDGVATCLAASPLLVTLTAAVGSVSDTATVTVAPLTLVSIAVTPPTIQLERGQTEEFAAIGTFSDSSIRRLSATDDGLTWTSANPSIVSIDASTGEATAESSGGPVTITATADGITGQATVTVEPPTLVSIVVNPPTVDLEIGESVEFFATGVFSDGTRSRLESDDGLVWTSAQPSIVEIDAAAGVATGRDEGGPVTITAAVGSVSATVMATVFAQPVVFRIRPNAGQANQLVNLYGQYIRPADASPGERPEDTTIGFFDREDPGIGVEVEDILVLEDEGDEQALRLRVPPRGGVLPLKVNVVLSRNELTANPVSFDYLR